MTRILFLLFLIATPALAQTFSESDTRKVQQTLADANYKPGSVDGKFGNKTAKAIRQYQSDWELPETGKISKDLIARLMREHEETKSRRQKAENQNCSVNNPRPQARETVTIFGECKSGLLNGQGKIIWRSRHNGQPQESSYVGEIRNGSLNGKGIYTWSNGARHEGEFRNDKPNGMGDKTWANGTQYKGEFRNGKQNGKGIKTWANGARYKGEYRDGKPNGKGIKTWANGARYDGEYRDGKRNGKGVMNWTNGIRYEGEFRNNIPHGQGVVIETNGRRSSGNWKMGCLTTGKLRRWIGTTKKACGFN